MNSQAQVDITQEQIEDLCNVNGYDDNCIYVVKTPNSMLLDDLEGKCLGYRMPHVATVKQIMKAVVKAEKREHRPVYMFQMPNVHTEYRTVDFICGVERVKDGIVMDFVTHKNMLFNRPQVFIFTQEVSPFINFNYKWKLYNHV